MKSLKQLISTTVINEAYQYITNDPMKNLPKLVDWADKVMVADCFRPALAMFREIAKDPTNNWNQLIQRYFNELNPITQKKFLINFMVNAGMVGNAIIDKSKERG